MVAISMTGLGLQVGVERQASLERENKQLKEQLNSDRLIADLRLSQTERSLETLLSEAQASERLAVVRAGDLVIANKRLTHSLFREKRHRELTENRLRRAKDRNESMLERAHAAEALAEATEAHALELDSQLSHALRLNLIYRDDNKTLREFASRHLPEVAPPRAQDDLDALRKNLKAAKADQTANRDYHISLACSGLRTFEASAAGYSCRLGQSLLAEARRLRQDPVCVAFENPDGISTSNSVAAN